MTPAGFLDFAGRLLDRPPASVGMRWPRSCVCLTRIALERAVEGYWHGRAPSLARATMRSQLIALATYTEPAVAREVAATWHALSRAMHHHAYELPPTVDELRSWHESVARLLSVLSPSSSISQ